MKGLSSSGGMGGLLSVGERNLSRIFSSLPISSPQAIFSVNTSHITIEKAYESALINSSRVGEPVPCGKKISGAMYCAVPTSLVHETAFPNTLRLVVLRTFLTEDPDLEKLTPLAKPKSSILTLQFPYN